jgi:hypothetical protein
MEKNGYIAKIGSMWVSDVYLHHEEINLTKDKTKAKHLINEEVEFIKLHVPEARVIRVIITVKEIGIG